MWRRILLVGFIFFFTNTFVVKAETCDSEDVARLRQLASMINADYKYVGNLDEYADYDDYQLYELYFLGLNDDGSDDIYIKLEGSNKTFYQSSEKVLVDSGKLRLGIYSNYCDDLKLDTITLNLPRYNTYSLYSSCKMLADYKLDICDEWYQGELTEAKFDQTINNYTEQLISKKDKLSLLEIIKKYYWVSFPIVLLIVFLGYRNYRRNRLD